jgi:hypothetical protein
MSVQPPQDPHMSPEAIKARNRRSIAIALALAAFVILVFVITLARMGGHVATTPY